MRQQIFTKLNMVTAPVAYVGMNDDMLNLDAPITVAGLGLYDNKAHWIDYLSKHKVR